MAAAPNPIIHFDTGVSVLPKSSLHGDTATDHIESNMIGMSPSPERYIHVGINKSSERQVYPESRWSSGNGSICA